MLLRRLLLVSRINASVHIYDLRRKTAVIRCVMKYATLYVVTSLLALTLRLGIKQPSASILHH